jgi:hypothetical protein
VKRRLLHTSGTSLTVEVQVLHRIQGRSASLSRQCSHMVKDVVLLLRLEPGQRSQALVHGVQEEGVDEGPPGLELNIPKYSKLIFLFVKYFSSYLHISPINLLIYILSNKICRYKCRCAMSCLLQDFQVTKKHVVFTSTYYY